MTRCLYVLSYKKDSLVQVCYNFVGSKGTHGDTWHTSIGKVKKETMYIFLVYHTSHGVTDFIWKKNPSRHKLSPNITSPKTPISYNHSSGFWRWWCPFKHANDRLRLGDLPRRDCSHIRSTCCLLDWFVWKKWYSSCLEERVTVWLSKASAFEVYSLHS